MRASVQVVDTAMAWRGARVRWWRPHGPRDAPCGDRVRAQTEEERSGTKAGQTGSLRTKEMEAAVDCELTGRLGEAERVVPGGCEAVTARRGDVGAAGSLASTWWRDDEAATARMGEGKACGPKGKGGPVGSSAGPKEEQGSR